MESTRWGNVVAGLIFLIGLGIFSYMGVYEWLPTLTLITGIALIVRQLLFANHVDVVVIFIVFGALFFSSFLQFFSRVFFPTFLMVGTVYFILRQFFTFKRKPKTVEVTLPQPSETTHG